MARAKTVKSTTRSAGTDFTFAAEYNAILVFNAANNLTLKLNTESHSVDLTLVDNLTGKTYEATAELVETQEGGR